MKHIGLLCFLGTSGFLAGCGLFPSHTPLATHRSPSTPDYTHSLISSGMAFANLPLAVQNTVRAEAGSASLDHVVKTNRLGNPVYEIYFEDALLDPPLFVAENGSVLNSDLRPATGAASEPGGVLSGGVRAGLKLEELPGPVLRTLSQQAPGASIQSISQQTWGNQIVYVIQFQNQPSSANLYLATDGQVLKGPTP